MTHVGTYGNADPLDVSQWTRLPFASTTSTSSWDDDRWVCPVSRPSDAVVAVTARTTGQGLPGTAARCLTALGRSLVRATPAFRLLTKYRCHRLEDVPTSISLVTYTNLPGGDAFQPLLSNLCTGSPLK